MSAQEVYDRLDQILGLRPYFGFWPSPGLHPGVLYRTESTLDAARVGGVAL